MLYTLDEIKNKIKYFCDVNYNIQEFVDGTNGEFVTKDHRYPCLYAAPVSFKMTNGRAKYTFGLVFMDLIYENSNSTKLLSDLGITLSEFATYFDDDSDENGYFVSSINETNFDSFNRGVDDTIGWSGNVEFSLPFNMNMNRINAKVDVVPDSSMEIFYGVSPLTSLTEQEIKLLPSHSQSVSRNREMSLNGQGQYIYYSYPVSFGTGTFMVNGFQVTMVQDTVTVDGTPYYTYRSQFVQYGLNIKIIVN